MMAENEQHQQAGPAVAIQPHQRPMVSAGAPGPQQYGISFRQNGKVTRHEAELSWSEVLFVREAQKSFPKRPAFDV